MDTAALAALQMCGPKPVPTLATDAVDMIEPDF
jgi:hypothetical protein